MIVVANGKRRALADGVNIQAFLHEFGLAPELVVVEHNGAPLRRELFALTPLCDGDTLEIAQMVGGG